MLNRVSAESALLFQYGSNMLAGRLREKIQEHQRFVPAGVSLEVRLLGPARLPSWRFRFGLYSARQECLVGDIIEGQDTDEVWGALYELDRELVFRSDGKRSVLDRIEGHRTDRDPENYHPANVTVDFSGAARNAHTYVGREDARRRCALDHANAAPRSEYLSAILVGARSVGLPAEYVRTLEAIVESPAQEVGSAPR
ncbi:MAG: gamma-glutamylcyclotransferase [Actinobacteria bacterium]|nr:gamma-glutamylcyclotransferase [Actinomycetota bacterium]